MDVKELIKFQNKWVAFTKDRKKIVYKSNSLGNLLKKVKKQEDLILSFIHPADRFLSP